MKIIALNRYWVIRWYWLVLHLLAIILLLGLSLWQWHRAVEKQKILLRINEWTKKEALTLEKLVLASQPEPQVVDMARVEFLAYWLAPNVWLLDNKVLKGRPGYDVIVPVQSRASLSAKNSAPVILVNLGWVAAPMQRDQLPAVNIPDEMHVQGIYRAQVPGVLLGINVEDKAGWPMRIQQIDTQLLSLYLPVKAQPGVIYQQQNSPFAPHYTPVVLSPERHKAYALQWLLLMVAVIVVSVVASAQKNIPEINN